MFTITQLMTLCQKKLVIEYHEEFDSIVTCLNLNAE